MAKGGYGYVACSGCDLTRLEPFPDDRSARTMYDDDYFAGAAHGGYGDYVRDAPLHRRNGRARIRRLGPPDRAGDVFVDVGCAFGYTMAAADAAGWTPIGIDPNETARRTVTDAGFGVGADWDDLELEPAAVGAVGFFQSLEHLADPVAALGRAACHLVDGGRLIIETWNRDSAVARLAGRRWQQATPPSVLWLFSRRDLEVLLDRAGFDVRTYRRTSKWVSLGLVGSQMRARDRSGPLVRAALALQRVPIPYALGDLVTVVARRRARD